MARSFKKRKPAPKKLRTRPLTGTPEFTELIEKYRATLFDAEVALWYMEDVMEPALDEAIAALALIARLETQPAAAEIARSGLARVNYLLD